MKILLCTSEVGNKAGGLAFHCGQLKEVFEDLGNEVFVEVLLNPDSLFVLDGGYDPVMGSKIRSSYMLKMLISTYEEKVDICVSCGGGRTAYYAMLFCKKNNIPLYVVLCGSEINLAYEQEKLAFYNAESLGYASAVIGLSEELNQNARRLKHNSNCQYYVIPNFCDLKNIPQGKKHYRNDERVVFASGATYLGEKKGIANLLKAFSILVHEKKRNDQLLLYGRIDEELKKQYQQMIKGLALEQNVVLCGYLDRQEFHERTLEADVYIQASPFEGFGNSVVEALSLGKDILITDTGYIAETIADEYAEHVMKSLDPKDMANDIYRYATEVVYRDEAEAIRLRLVDVLDKKNIEKKWEIVLRQEKSRGMEIGADSCIAVMFHDIESSYTGIDYAPKGFEEILRKLSQRGLRLCSAQEFFEHPQPECMIVCSFDDGYESVYRNAFPLMRKYGFTATVYMCPDLIGKDNSWNHKDGTVRMHMTSEMLKELCDSGWEVGSHGMFHINLLRLTEHELDECLEKSKEQLGKFGRVESFCYPYGQFNSFIKAKVKNYYKNAFSTDIGGNNYVNDMFQITRLTPEQLIKRLEL